MTHVNAFYAIYPKIGLIFPVAVEMVNEGYIVGVILLYRLICENYIPNAQLLVIASVDARKLTLNMSFKSFYRFSVCAFDFSVRSGT